jgi:hypothetical protein
VPKLLGALGVLKGVLENLNHLEIIIDQEVLFRIKESIKFIPVQSHDSGLSNDVGIAKENGRVVIML